jgi:hypothetical protein
MGRRRRAGPRVWVRSEVKEEAMSCALRRCALAALGLVVAMAGRSEAGIVINFDDVSAPFAYRQVTPGGADGPVYSRSGVTFSGGVVLNSITFSPAADSPPNIYATTDIQGLADGSFLPGSISATLAPPRLGADVSLFVGNALFGFGPGTFTLTAFDASNHVLGSAAATLAFNQGTTLSVTAPGFTRFTVTTSQQFSQNFYIDSVNIDLVAAAPEPSTLAGGVTGVALALGCAWRRRRAKPAA